MTNLMENGRYLPPFLRDFHDCKDCFKRIDEIVQNAKVNKDGTENYLMRDAPSWADAHIYVIDFFLWYMARCGYTLQRTRVKGNYIDYHEDLKAYQERWRKANPLP